MGLAPSEFWGMRIEHFYWLFDAKYKEIETTKKRLAKGKGLAAVSEAEWAEASERLRAKQND